MLDLYCERCGPGLLAEPINAVTSLAFPIAGWAAWMLARRGAGLPAGVGTLVALSVAIGVGSVAFHTFATPWARWLDILPILMFQVGFLWIYLRRVVGAGRPAASAAIAGLLAGVALGRRYPGVLNGSLIYAPAFVVLVGLGVYHARAGEPGRFVLLLAAGVFALSLACRSIDEAVCPYVPIGTHFLWHLLNGALLYLSMKALILNPKCGRAPSRPA